METQTLRILVEAKTSAMSQCCFWLNLLDFMFAFGGNCSATGVYFYTGIYSARTWRGRIEMSLIVISYIVTNETAGLVFKPDWKLRVSSSPCGDLETQLKVNEEHLINF